MPLIKGEHSYNKNIKELMTQPIESDSRRKAIKTISKRYDLTMEEARKFQAVKISKSLMYKK